MVAEFRASRSAASIASLCESVCAACQVANHSSPRVRVPGVLMARFKDCVLPFSGLFVQGKKLAAAVLRRISDSPPWHIERHSVMALV